MTDRELLEKFIDYVYYLPNPSAWHVAIGSFLEEGRRAPVNWTTEYPTQPGYYWIRNYTIDCYPKRPEWNELTPGPEIVDINDALDLIFQTGTECAIYRRELLSAEWHGPILPPEGKVK